MATFDLVREDGGGEQTIVTVRVAEECWTGREKIVEIVAIRKVQPEEQL